jgi:uncharacterized membrane protein
MIDKLISILTFSSGLGCGVIGGVFFAFSAFVMKALARLSPAHGIAAMQSINIVVINPLFFAVFFGTAAGCVFLAISRWLGGKDPAQFICSSAAFSIWSGQSW